MMDAKFESRLMLGYPKCVDVAKPITGELNAGTGIYA